MGKGRAGKLLIWAACPAGAGSSTMIKLQAQDIVDAAGLGNKVELDAVGSSVVNAGSCDLVLCTLNLVPMLEKMSGVPVVGIKNVMSNQEYEEKLIPAIRKLLEKEPKN
jgi:galactitol-specific phosphotransferase system IIB component